MPLFFLPPQSITPPAISITGQLVTHVRDSLRAKVGHELLIGDGHARRYLIVVTEITKTSIQGRILETLLRPAPSTPGLVLGQALLKGEKMDWVVQKATELGVRRIVPLQTQHGVVRPRQERIEAQRARWQRIALEAAQQSEQWSVPTIEPPEPLSRFLQDTAVSRSLILTERRKTVMNLRDVSLPSTPAETIALIVGPEGGWTGEETGQAEKAGAVPITLGPEILRAETAALVTVGILQFRLGILG